MTGDVKFEGTQEEWDALVKKNRADGLKELIGRLEYRLGALIHKYPNGEHTLKEMMENDNQINLLITLLPLLKELQKEEDKP